MMMTFVAMPEHHHNHFDDDDSDYEMMGMNMIANNADENLR